MIETIKLANTFPKKSNLKKSILNIKKEKCIFIFLPKGTSL